MAHFAYKARNGTGKLITGTLEAESARHAAQNLIMRNLTPVSIKPTSVNTDLIKAFDYWRARNRLGNSDLAIFSRQMHGLTKAGVPITRAVNSLADSTRNIALKQALRDIVRRLESGQSLAQGMAQYPKIFPTLLVSIINVGETSGGLEEAFLQIAHYLDREKDTQANIKAALRYPSMVVIAISIALAIVNVFVIPAFKGVFDRMHTELPWQTQLLMTVSDFTVHYWSYILGGLVIVSLLIVKYLRTSDGRRHWHWLLLKIPAIGSIIEQATMERFSRSFAMILSSGVPLIQGISVVSKAIGNDYIGSKLEKMRIGIEKGDSISRMAQSIGLFPSLVIQMLVVGEETGNISDMLLEVADFYAAEVDAELKNLSSAIEPLLLVVVGAMVLVLALGIFLPMWDLSTAIK